MPRSSVVRIAIALTTLTVVWPDSRLTAADVQQFPFEVRETAGIRRRNDVITLRSSKPEITGHNGGFRILSGDEPVPAQVRLVEWPGEPKELVVDFVDHFQPLESREYALELTDEPTTGEPANGLQLTETADAYQIVSGGVAWTIRKDLAGLLDFSWKGTDYVKDASRGLIFSGEVGGYQQVSGTAPMRCAVERSGPIAVGLRFDYDNCPPGARSSVRLEFPRTKSWIHATWTVNGNLEKAYDLRAELNLRLDGPEALVDFGAGDFFYTTVTPEQSAILEAGPRTGPSVPWRVLHGALEQEGEVVVSPPNAPSSRVHGWAHVMDDKRCTALAMAGFAEATYDSIDIHGSGRLQWGKRFDDRTRAGVRQLEFWLHFVTMPVHIGARTSPRSMQQPLQVAWPFE